MKHALIVGASGLIGKALLELLLKGDDYSKVIAIGRRRVDVAHPKLESRIIDFDNIAELVVSNKIHDLFICLGTTMRLAGSREAFYRVDHDYVAAFARWGYAHGVEKVLVVSSMGAKVQSGNFYLRSKGEMEESVIQSGIGAVFIFRPSLLVGVRSEYRLGEKIGEWLLWFLRPLLLGRLKRFRSIKASQVANAMYNTAQSHRKIVYIMESDDIAMI